MKSQNYPYPSQRMCTYGKNVVATSNPSASAAGIEILRKGGNAIDAAIAVASTMVVTEPTCNGLGSDLFTIFWKDGEIHGFNGSGKSPKGLNINEVKDRGYEKIPFDGVVPIMVPGAVDAWVKIQERFGKLSFADCLAPAIKYAYEGFLVSPTLALLWEDSWNRFKKHQGDPLFEPWFHTFAPNGKVPKEGELFKNIDLGNTLSSIAKTKGESFYRGELADKIEAFLKEHDGYLKKSDLMEHTGEWVTPLSVNYKGVDVWEIPPNGHGITVLMALEILKQLPLETMEETEKRHHIIEALKLAYTDTKEYIADKNFMTVTSEELLDSEYSKKRSRLITPKAQEPSVGIPGAGSTVYFAVADAEGTMVSMIQSNYEGFGSGVVIPNTSIALNDRGVNFYLREGHPNALEGGKRSYHTIIPGFLTKEGKPYGAFGVMGGFMQPQGQLQVILRLLLENRNPQAALDAPRWQWTGGKNLELESDLKEEEIIDLKQRGHQVTVCSDLRNMGRGQVILKTEHGYCAGTEKRTDGTIASF